MTATQELRKSLSVREQFPFCSFFLSHLLYESSLGIFFFFLPSNTIPSWSSCDYIYGMWSRLPESHTGPCFYDATGISIPRCMEVRWSILFNAVVLIHTPLYLCIIQAPFLSTVDDIVQNNNKNVANRNRNQCGNLEQPPRHTPESERNNKHLRMERAGEEVYVIHHERERRRNANYSHTRAEKWALADKTFARVPSSDQTSPKAAGRITTCTLREMTQTSTYCPVRSINSSHWAVSTPASVLFPVIHHVSTPPSSLTSCPPTWTQGSLFERAVTCDGWSPNLVAILPVLPAYCVTSSLAKLN